MHSLKIYNNFHDNHQFRKNATLPLEIQKLHQHHTIKIITIQVRKNAALPPENRKLMCTARPNWLSLSTTFFNKEECHKVSFIIIAVVLMIFYQVPLPLYDILALDEDNLTVTVEPMVTVSATILETYF